MKIKKSGDHRVRRDIDGVPTIQLGEGDVGVVTLHKGPPGTGPAGVGFLLSEGREQGDIDFHPDCSKMLLKIVSSNPEGQAAMAREPGKAQDARQSIREGN